ncbi:type IV toxin-antitoxin system AbiEi family antitoxin domain-containing protein [Alloscardovia macacae]|uniref:Transcriptional regulator n=1 Tax=Alloscardovia macacae TaxID=1160091 RepID=A0A261F6V3_9BIFI|nr:type IV toxin-antitoxin system AbiEi family antitoxin domain-containing protein [Alloscardovia macacae]OZG54870.1 transcriptional regulator [Alloscardovia macacae]
MKETEKILQLTKAHHGIITTRAITRAGLSRGTLSYLVHSGKLERTSRGVYSLPSTWDDDFLTIQSRFSRAIFSLETALYLHDLTDTTPARYSVSFPATYNMTSAKQEGLQCHALVERLYSLEVSDVRTPAGHTVKAYSKERTLCDVLRPINHTDPFTRAEAFKRYMRLPERNIPLLSRMGKELGVQNALRHYLEVLL